jgi:cytoskeletal protein RodZ
MTEERAKRPDVSVIQVMAGALAALSAAVIASTLGVEGTIAGAALGSVVATAGGAWYSWSLERTHHRLRTQAQTIVATTRSRAGKGQPPAGAVKSAEPTSPDDAVAGQEIQKEGTGEGHEGEQSGERRRKPRWWMLGLAALGAFVIAMVAITAFELMTGKPLAAQVGGTDVGGTTLNPEPGKAPAPAPTESPSMPTTGSTPDATSTAEPTPPQPTPTQTPTTSATPTKPAGGTPG